MVPDDRQDMTSARDVDPASGLTVGHLLANAGMGGAENYVMLLANEHAARGGCSCVVVLSEPGPISSRFDPAVEVCYLGYERASIRNPFKFAASVWRGYRLIAGALRRHGVQVLQTHLPDTNLWGLTMSLRGICHVVITIHNNRFLRNVSGPAFTRSLKTRAYRAMVRRCGAVVTVTAEVRNSLVETLGLTDEQAARIRVVDNGVPIPEPLPAAELVRIRKRHGVAPDEFWIVAAGRLTEAKNFPCLIRAARILKDEGTFLRVLIGGEGPLRGDLNQQVADLGLEGTVVLPGNLDDLGEVMMAADLLAMPSNWEGLPLTLLEALARGLPVVGTRIKGLIDIVEDGVQGLLVDVDDHDALAAACGRLASDPETRERMGRECLSLAREKYGFQRVYGDLARIYAEVADS